MNILDCDWVISNLEVMFGKVLSRVAACTTWDDPAEFCYFTTLLPIDISPNLMFYS